MSWECIRDLNRMYPLINIIHNLANQNEAPEPVIESIIKVRRNFKEVRTAFIKNRSEILALPQALPQTPTIDLAEYLYFIEQNHLSGIGIGFVDVHLLSSAKLFGIPLWTNDKRLKETALKLKIFYI